MSNRKIRALSLLVWTSALSLNLEAQTITGEVVGPTGEPLPYSTVSITPGQTRFTAEDGRFSFSVQPNTPYRISVRHLGFAALDTTIRWNVTQDKRIRLTMNPISLRLGSVEVRGRSQCGTARNPGSDLHIVLGELRKNADRDRLLRTEYPFVYRFARQYDTYDPDIRVFGTRRDFALYRSTTTDEYLPGRVVRQATDKRRRSAREARIPNLSDLAGNVFWTTHCFTYGGVVSEGGRDAYRIDFLPAPGIRSDFAGSAYLDTKTFAIKKAVFSLTDPDKHFPPIVAFEVTTTFRELYPGLLIVDAIRGVQSVPPSQYGRSELVDDQKLVEVRFIRATPGKLDSGNSIIRP